MNKRFLLPSLGLVLSGMALGVLLMQFYGAPAPTSASSEGRVVQSIQVGIPEYETPVPAVDPMTVNRLFKQVARQVTPTVVSVRAGLRASGQDGQTDWFGYHNGGLRMSAGSGVIVSDDGYVVTNHHVVNEAELIEVHLADKREYEAELIGVDPTTDLAVLRIDAEALPVVMLGNSDNVEVGEWVIAVGNPFHLNSTVTQGIVSALSRNVNIIGDDLGIEDFIQTDAAINPGNSGGALVNLRGQLIGINTAIATERGSYEGYGFAVPVNLVTQVMTDLIAFGRVRRGMLGISMEPVTSQNHEALGLEAINGVRVAEVARDGPAWRAGLEPDDVIVAINGVSVDAPNQLQSRIALNRPGDQVDIDVLREGQALSYQILLADPESEAIQRWLPRRATPPRAEEALPFEEDLTRPDSPFEELEHWGLVLRELNAQDREGFGLEEGAYVAHVRGDTPADEDGLPRDVVVTEIAGEPVESLEDAFTILDLAVAEERTSVVFGVKRRDGIMAFYEVEVPATL